MTKREGCGFPFFVAQMYARRRVRLRGRALEEKRVFVRQLCRQSFPLRANGFSRSVRRQYALTFFRLFAPVRLLLLQHLFFRSFRSLCLFSSAAPTAVPLRSDVFLRTYALCSDVFSPVCVPPNCCFCTRPFFLLLFCRCLARKSLPINNAKTDSSQRQKTVFAVNDKLFDTQKVKQKRLT